MFLLAPAVGEVVGDPYCWPWHSAEGCGCVGKWVLRPPTNHYIHIRSITVFMVIAIKSPLNAIKSH
jgi:hypothetical protein